MKRPLSHNPWFPRVLPFAAFMAFVGLEELISYLSGISPSLATVARYSPYILYPVKTIFVAGIILILRKRFTELRFGDLGPANLILSVLTGAVVFILWINLSSLSFGSPRGFDPSLFGSVTVFYALLAIRLFGATVVVSLMEEIFWRSFLLRYLIDDDFEKVEIGAFTWLSFLVSSVLFGLEHHLWFAGIVAGAAYNMLLYRTRSLASSVVSHSVTNFMLGIYVLYTGSWQYW